MDDLSNQPSTSRGFVGNDTSENNESSTSSNSRDTERMKEEFIKLRRVFSSPNTLSIDLSEVLETLNNCIPNASFKTTCDGDNTISPFVESALILGNSTDIYGKKVDSVCKDIGSLGKVLQEKEHYLNESYRERQLQEEYANSEATSTKNKLSEEARQNKLEAKRAKESAAKLLVTAQTPLLNDLQEAGPSGIQRSTIKDEEVKPEINEAERIRRIQENEERKKQAKIREQEKIARNKEKEMELLLEQQKEDLELAENLGINPSHFVEGLLQQDELVTKTYETLNNSMNIKTEELNEHIKGNSYINFELPFLDYKLKEIKDISNIINNYGSIFNDNKYFINTENLYMSDKLITCDSTVPALLDEISAAQLDNDSQDNNPVTNTTQVDTSLVDSAVDTSLVDSGVDNNTTNESLQNAINDPLKSINTSTEDVDIENVIQNSANKESVTEVNANVSRKRKNEKLNNSVIDDKLDILLSNIKNIFKIPVKHLKRKLTFELPRDVRVHNYNTRNIQLDIKRLKESPKVKKAGDVTISDYIEQRRDSGSCSISVCSEVPVPLPVGEKIRTSEDMGYVTSSPMADVVDNELMNSQSLKTLSQMTHKTFDSGVGMFCSLDTVLDETNMTLEQSSAVAHERNEEIDTNSRLKMILLKKNLKTIYNIPDSRMTKRVLDWIACNNRRENMNKQRRPFDAVRYQSHLLKSIENRGDSYTTLAVIMRYEPPIDLSRNFESSLQLTNAQKITIHQTSDCFLEPESVILKLVLSTLESKSNQSIEGDSAISDMSSGTLASGFMPQSSNSLDPPTPEEDTETPNGKGKIKCYSKRSKQTATSTPKSKVHPNSEEFATVVTSTPAVSIQFENGFASTSRMACATSQPGTISIISSSSFTKRKYVTQLETVTSSASFPHPMTTVTHNKQKSCGANNSVYSETSMLTEVSEDPSYYDPSTPKKFAMSNQDSNERPFTVPVVQSPSIQSDRLYVGTYKRMMVRSNSDSVERDLFNPNNRDLNPMQIAVSNTSVEREPKLILNNCTVNKQLRTMSPAHNLSLQVQSKYSFNTALCNISDPGASTSREDSINGAVSYNVSKSNINGLNKSRQNDTNRPSPPPTSSF